MKKCFFVLTSLCLLGSTNAYAQELLQVCPGALPAPAEQWMVICKAIPNRCASALPPDECRRHNDSSHTWGLLTKPAYDWLVANGYCAVNGGDSWRQILAICPVGCFGESTDILTLDDQGAQEWRAAKTITMEHELFSLNADALLSFPQLSSHSIERMTAGPEEPDLYVFAMSNGRKLRVTSHHAMVLADGRIVEAEDVVEDDSFIGIDGSEVGIDAITRESTNADVYNFSVAVDTPQEHVIAAEGVLVGDLAWQSTLAGEMASIRIRR